MAKLNWKEEPDDHDYPAASDYLSLTVEPEIAAAGDPPPQGADHPLQGEGPAPGEPLGVTAHQQRPRRQGRRQAEQGKLLSPVLLIRGRLRDSIPLTIADGYHRICASYHIDEDADIRCRMVDLAGTAPEG